MRIKELVILMFLCATAGFIASAEDSVGIAAVVNDQVISSIDLNDRLALVAGTTGIVITDESRPRIAAQILRQLIDEKLEMQEATQSSISISDAKLHEGIARIEKQSGRPSGSLEQLLESKGLSKMSFYAQVRSQMAWTEIVAKKVKPKIRISDQEVARYVRRKAATPESAKEVLIAVIQLPVDSPDNESSVRSLATKLASEIRAGASFEAVAAQFSSHTGSASAADPFWVELSQVDPLIGKALISTAKGSITDPVRTANGYQVIKFVDARQAHGETAANPVAMTEMLRSELAFKQVLMTLKPDAKEKEAELLLQLAKEVAKSPGKCSEKTMAGAGDLAALDFNVTLTRAMSNDLPEKLRDLLMKLSVGAASEPVVTPQGIRLFMLCERTDLPPAKVSAELADDAGRQALYEEKLELEAQKYLRNLRREAFIEIR